MRCFSLVAVLALSSGLAAQTAAAPAVTYLVSGDENCPVGLTARHSSSGAVVQVSPSAKPVYKGYRLRFTPRDARAIAGAKVTLFGLAGAHVIPARDSTRPPQSESFTLTPSPSGTMHYQSVVYAEKLTAVQYLELDELTYTDGTIWHGQRDAPCRIRPNGFMLVSEK